MTTRHLPRERLPNRRASCTLDVLRGALLRDVRGKAATPLGVALDLLTEQGTGSAP
jgi:hypothetical protein